MACSNCFNGCAEITSDQCVKYTGLSIPALGITNGDPLSKVEESITNVLLEVLTGTNIVPTIDPDIVCNLVKDFLPVSDVNLVDYIVALIKASCSLQTQLDVEVGRIDTIEADYTVGCLAVSPSAGTHDILQAVIVKVCSLNASLGALTLNLSTNYSSNGAQLDAYIANYLSSHTPTSTLMSNKMVPYVPTLCSLWCISNFIIILIKPSSSSHYTPPPASYKNTPRSSARSRQTSPHTFLHSSFHSPASGPPVPVHHKQ